jgi:nuclear pore complex protein Nup205
MAGTGSQTIPEGLGHPYRHVPLTPYSSFIVDDVLWLAEDAFKTPTEQWLMKDICLKFIEKSLSAYDLESLPVALQTISSMGPQVIRPWIVHPGFDLMVRIFSDTKLRALLGDFLAFGVEKLEKGSIKTVFFQSCMRRVARIVHRVLDVQSFFLDMLVPTLQSFDFSPLLASNFAPGQLSALDRHLLFNHLLVERIALLVIIPDQELQLLSIRILGMLALSPHFTVMDQQASRMARRLNRLAVIIQNSEDSIRINDGLAALLGTGSAESDDVHELELRIGAGAPDPDDVSASSTNPFSIDDDLAAALTHTIRLEIIDLFLKNTERGRPAPNIAHLLLGFDVAASSKNEMTIQDPSAINSTRSCFHVMTEMLSDGIPFLDAAQRRREEKERGNLYGTVLYLKAPLLAEKCHKLLYQLCSHELTSKPASRYLRTREDYFARNLAALPVRAPEVLTEAEGLVNYADGVSVDSNCRSLTSFLRMRSWLLESVALELHLLTDDRQFPRASRLLDILYGTINRETPAAEREDDDAMNDEFFASGSGGGSALTLFAPGQSQIRTLEIFQSFDLVWQETNISASEVPLIFFTGLDYTSCLRIAESGAEIIDREALITLLSHIRASKQDKETLTPEAQNQLAKEMRFLLESCVKENNRREIEHAKAVGFESWRRVVNTSLAKCFDRLPQDSREGLLFDILQEIPPVIRRPTTAVPSAVVLSEVMVMLITKLREDRSQRILLQTLTEDDPTTGVGVTSVPEDRFHALLRSLLESVLTPGMPEVVRGNLYASVINHLQLVHTITAARKQSHPLDDDEDERQESLFGSKSMEVQRFPSLETGCVNIINSLAERVMPVLCRDSIDGSEVWKTVSFTLLETLVRLSRIQRQHRSLHLLARGGYLNNFAVGLKEADEELQSLLTPDPGM